MALSQLAVAAPLVFFDYYKWGVMAAVLHAIFLFSQWLSIIEAVAHNFGVYYLANIPVKSMVFSRWGLLVITLSGVISYCTIIFLKLPFLGGYLLVTFWILLTLFSAIRIGESLVRSKVLMKLGVVDAYFLLFTQNTLRWIAPLLVVVSFGNDDIGSVLLFIFCSATLSILFFMVTIWTAPNASGKQVNNIVVVKSGHSQALYIAGFSLAGLAAFQYDRLFLSGNTDLAYLKIHNYLFAMVLFVTPAIHWIQKTLIIESGKYSQLMEKSVRIVLVIQFLLAIACIAIPNIFPVSTILVSSAFLFFGYCVHILAHVSYLLMLNRQLFSRIFIINVCLVLFALLTSQFVFLKPHIMFFLICNLQCLFYSIYILNYRKKKYEY